LYEEWLKEAGRTPRELEDAEAEASAQVDRAAVEALESREQVRRMIGERAEKLGYLNCAMDRATFDAAAEENGETYHFVDRITREIIDVRMIVAMNQVAILIPSGRSKMFMIVV